MAKGVNDVLNYYIQVTDTKASIFIAGSVASASFLLTKFPEGLGARLLYSAAASSLGAALVLATLVVLPRLPVCSSSGSVFWGDIAGCSSPCEYRDRFAKTASAGLLDEEYSILNFYTARILDKKIRVLRRSILCFLTGVLTALPHHLMNA
ncbi:MAG: Pycsar system effector family protein [Verrucomicrobiales bacterium]